MSWFENPHHEISLKGSKALGEPPLLLGISAWAAVRQAVAAVNHAGADHLTLPATGETVLMCLERGVARPAEASQVLTRM